jgi:hypothetical protein
MSMDLHDSEGHVFKFLRQCFQQSGLRSIYEEVIARKYL